MTFPEIPLLGPYTTDRIRTYVASRMPEACRTALEREVEHRDVQVCQVDMGGQRVELTDDTVLIYRGGSWRP